MTLRSSFALVPILFLAALGGCAPKKHALTTVTTTNNAPLVAAVDPNLVELTAEATTTLVLASATSDLGVRVRIHAKELPAARRPALNLSLVLDTSGSMEGKAIEALRDSARQLAAKLRDGDRISVVVFHSKAEVLVNNVTVSQGNRAHIDDAIKAIHATGTTDLVDGLAMGLSQLGAGMLPNGINRVVLLSDGIPNSSVQLPQMIAAIRQRGVSVTSLGFGIDYDTALMTQIARDTGGSFHYLEKPEEVASVFDDELVKMTTAVARNMQLTIEPGPGVTIVAMPGITAGGDGKFYAAIGDLPAGETRDLMIPIQLSARGEGSTAELALASLTFEDVIGHSGTRTREGFVSAKASRDAAAIKAAVKIDLEVARIRAAAAGAILQAMALARSGQIAPARQNLAAAMAVVKAAAAKYKDPELDGLVKQLEQVAKEISQLVVIAQPMQPDPRGVPKLPTTAPAPATAPSMDVESHLRRAEEGAARAVRGEASR